MRALAGRTVLVTGGARRVGAAICRRLHRAGANVVIHYRTSRREAFGLRRRLEADRHGSALCVCADLLDSGALGELVAAATTRFGRLDAVVNNASSFYPTPLAGITAAQWNDLVGTHLQGPLFLVQAAAKELARRRGSVVNIVDVHAERPLEGYLVYSVAKAGLRQLVRVTARELGPHGIRVNGVAPGFTLTGLTAPTQQIPGFIENAAKRVPLGRVGQPDDIAQAVVALFALGWVSGETLSVDGGQHLSGPNQALSQV